MSMKKNQSRIMKILIVVVIIVAVIGCFEVYHYYKYPIEKKVVERVDGTLLMRGSTSEETIPISIVVEAVESTYFFKNKQATLLGELRVLHNEEAVFETELYVDNLAVNIHNAENHNTEPSVFTLVTADLNHILIGAPKKYFLFDKMGDDISKEENLLVVASKDANENAEDIILFFEEESSAVEEWLRENGW